MSTQSISEINKWVNPDKFGQEKSRGVFLFQFLMLFVLVHMNNSYDILFWELLDH